MSRSTSETPTHREAAPPQADDAPGLDALGPSDRSADASPLSPVAGLPPEPPPPEGLAVPPVDERSALAMSGEVVVDPGEVSSAPISWRTRLLRWGSPSFASMVVHAWLLLALALMVVAQEKPWRPTTLSSSIAEPAPELMELEVQPVELKHAPVVRTGESQSIAADQIEIVPDFRLGGGELTGGAAEGLTSSNILMPVGRGGGLDGRRPRARAALVRLRGGSAASELAVARGLRWLAAHQMDNGAWRFNHQQAPGCRGLCRDPGSVASTTAATALALLPLLGAGSTHQQGEFQEQVQRGIYYLAGRMHVSERGGDLQEGTMYAQGIGTIALCEAYAMSGDPALRDFCQAAVDFIVHAQHQRGGWRYLPGQPGDTTSLGWQLMALKSAQMAGLRVPPATLYSAGRFLDRVSQAGGAHYGYQRPGRGKATTAIGLLSRMYLGWQRDEAALIRGVTFLAGEGPSKENMYYNYYATQVLHHYEGEYWTAWNEQLRDYLITAQATEGHESGSWQFNDPKTDSAGRLYDTAMAVMILEVYYRHLPLYDYGVMEHVDAR